MIDKLKSYDIIQHQFMISKEKTQKTKNRKKFLHTNNKPLWKKT